MNNTAAPTTCTTYLVHCDASSTPLMGTIDSLARTLLPGTYRALCFCGGDITEAMLAITSEDTFYAYSMTTHN
jgi:hypothetical protein